MVLHAPVPTLFGPPTRVHDPPLRYLSAVEFEDRIVELCAKVKSRIADCVVPHVVLWVPQPGKSNFWITARCWPLLRDIVDEVWAWPNPAEPFYGGGEFLQSVHLVLDDALFTGQQMTEKLLEDMLFLPAADIYGADNHLIIVGALAATPAAIRHILRCHSKLSKYASESSDDDEEEEEEQYELSATVEVLTTMRLADALYYSCYKVPDAVSIPLHELVAGGYISGASADKIKGRDLVEPLPPYKQFEITWRRQPLDWREFATVGLGHSSRGSEY